jgi:hypothetical protein
MPASISVFPVVRTSPQMHHRKYEHPAVLNTVKHAIRKTIQETAPNIVFDDGPGIRVIDNVLYGGKDLGGEIIAEASFTIFVVLNSGLKLFFCFGMK